MRVCRTRICPCSRAPISSDLRCYGVAHVLMCFLSMYHIASRCLRTKLVAFLLVVGRFRCFRCMRIGTYVHRIMPVFILWNLLGRGRIK